jgi:uncharacterized membrane protein
MSKKAKERLLLKKKKDKQKKIFFGVVGGIVVILVIALIMFLNLRDSGGVVDYGEPAEQATVDASGQNVYVPISDVNDENLHFYEYETRGKTVRYFIVRGSDLKYHAALDLCQKLHPARSGWRQEGGNIVCKDELCAYPINYIGTEQPGCCWPFTLPFEIVGNEFKIKISDLDANAHYF